MKVFNPKALGPSKIKTDLDLVRRVRVHPPGQCGERYRARNTPGGARLRYHWDFVSADLDGVQAIDVGLGHTGICANRHSQQLGSQRQK